MDQNTGEKIKGKVTNECFRSFIACLCPDSLCFRSQSQCRHLQLKKGRDASVAEKFSKSLYGDLSNLAKRLRPLVNSGIRLGESLTSTESLLLLLVILSLN